VSGVARAGPERLDVLASTFGRAFVNEPMMLWPMGLAGDVADPLTCCFRYFLEAALGLGVVWEVADGRGAAVWVAPAQADAWEATNPWDQARIGALTDDGGRRYEGFWAWVDSRTPQEPLWLLDSIAVSPACQGRGLGSALIAAGLTRAAAAGLPAFLSTGTRRNVDIYRRSGFGVVDEADAPGGGPHIWFMRRDPPDASR
jgi:GNAT superfamily N-acetyltransferase